MLAPPMLAWSKFALRRSAPLKLVNSSCEREKKAPARLVSWNTAARRSQLEKSMPGSFMLLNTARSPASPFEAIHLQCADSLASIRSEEHTSELQSLMRISYAVF